MCLLDRDGKPWKDLWSLAQFTYAEELKLNTRLAASRADTPVPSCPPRKQWGFQPAKKARVEGPVVAAMEVEELGGSLAAIKVTGVKRSASGVPRAPRAGGLEPRRVPPAKKGPIEACPLFRVQTPNGMTAAQKAICNEYGLCWFCKKGQHYAKECPEKGKGGQGGDPSEAGPSSRAA